jgi:hypothetical protein
LTSSGLSKGACNFDPFPVVPGQKLYSSCYLKQL